MPDEIIEELWKIKDDIAREHDNDIRKLASYLERERLERLSSKSMGRSVPDDIRDESLKRRRVADSPR